jgi:hypothetical protein
MNDIENNAEKIEAAFNEVIPPICLKSNDGGSGVLTFAPAGSGKYLALYDRGDHFNPRDAVAEPNKPIAFYDNFEQVAVDGWQVD